jgi:epoxyqueuosine reductase
MIELEKSVYKEGASLVGFADLQSLDGAMRDNLPFGVSIGCALDRRIISHITNGPTYEYYNEYTRTNEKLERISSFIVSFIEQRGFHALSLRPTTDNYNRNTLSVTLPHKTVATRAGLGWIGRSALLVTEKYGSAIRFTTVLTDMDLPVGIPIEGSRCGECSACVDACPANAPSGDKWSVGMKRDEFFNAHSCRRKARELSGRIGLHTSICGICIVSCPWTQKYIQGVRS